MDVEISAEKDCNANGVPDSCDLMPVLGFRSAWGISTIRPSRLTGSDLNGDGLLDLVAVEHGAMSILWNRGARSFSPPVPIPFEEDALVIESIEANGAPGADLLVGGGSASGLFLLLNDGTGGFSTPLDIPIEGQPRHLRAADMDADGTPDVVVGTRDPNRLWIFWGLGEGRFEAQDISFLDAGGLFVGDFAGDALPDICARPRGREASRLFIWKNSGERELDLFSTDLRMAASSPSPLDLDGDGDPDSIWSEGSDLTVDLGAGRDSTAVDERRRIPLPFEPLEFIADDIDSDGDRDIIMLGEDFQSICTFSNDGLANLELCECYQGRGRSLAADDLDADGLVDIYGINVLWNVHSAPGHFEAARKLPTFGQTRAVTAGILDIDDFPGIALATTAGIEVLVGEKDFAFSPRLRIEIPNGARDVEIADLDGDGFGDVIYVEPRGLFALFRHPEGFSEPETILGEVELGRVRATDWNGDGRVDIAVFRREPNTLVLLRNDDGRDLNMARSLRVPGQQEGFALGDFDNDGIHDIALGYEAQVSIYIGDVTGDYSERERHGFSTLIYGIETQDVDRDGDLDLIVANLRDVWLLENESASGFRGPIRIGGGENIHDLVLNDLDGDGLVEAVVTSMGTSGDYVLVFPNLGAAAFGDALVFESGHSPETLFARDLDGDERIDLGVGNAEGMTLTILPNTSLPAFEDENENGILDVCEIGFHRGDPNADGDLDLADPTFLIAWRFFGGTPPGCRGSADANDDKRLDVADAVYLLGFLYLDGPAPPHPGPPRFECGTAHEGDGALECEVYDACVE